MIKTRILPVIALTSLFATPLAHAQTSGCNTNTSGNDMIGRLANKENCINERMQNWQDQNKAAREAQQKKIDDLKDKYANAPEREKQRIQDNINAQKDRLDNMKSEQTRKIDELKDKYANAPEREKQRIQDNINAQKDRLNNMKAAQTQKIDQLRSAQRLQNDRVKALTQKTKHDFSNFGRLR